jgi:hypothetical protein
MLEVVKNMPLVLAFKTKCANCKKDLASIYPPIYPVYCKDCISKNEDIKKIAGIREPGMPYQIPFELDYHCPICGTEPVKQKKFDDSLDFSEYRYFMFCPRCNIDIPSFLCLKANTKEKVEMYTKRYLEMIQYIRRPKERGKRSEEPERVRRNLAQLLLITMLDTSTPIRITREQSLSKVSKETKKKAKQKKVLEYPFSRLRLNKYLYLISRLDKNLQEALKFRTMIF